MLYHFLKYVEHINQQIITNVPETIKRHEQLIKSQVASVPHNVFLIDVEFFKQTIQNESRTIHLDAINNVVTKEDG